jgi:hypothetical protein
VLGFLLLFLLPCLDGLQHIAGLGDVREIDLGSDQLRRARCRRGSMAGRLRSVLKMRANLNRFVVLNRAGMRFAGRKAKLRQYVKNLLALDFHLASEIIDSNLTHPPLFKLCYPNTTLVAHSYLMDLAAFQSCILVVPE